MLTFPGGKTKCLTFSYDDGIFQDMRLVQLFNLHGIKGTFNLNSGKMSRVDVWQNQDVQVRHMEPEHLKELYLGQEVAVHTVHHKHLYALSDEELSAELAQDKIALENLFGYPIYGMAYPFGDCDERIEAAVAKEGLYYGRCVQTTGTFALPENPLAWKGTAHHNDPKLMDYAEQFLSDGDELRLFYIWGHSYEFDVNRNWNVIEDLCAKLGGRDDVWYATNGEVVRWMKQNKLC